MPTIDTFVWQNNVFYYTSLISYVFFWNATWLLNSQSYIAVPFSASDVTFIIIVLCFIISKNQFLLLYTIWWYCLIVDLDQWSNCYYEYFTLIDITLMPLNFSVQYWIFDVPYCSHGYPIDLTIYTCPYWLQHILLKLK